MRADARCGIFTCGLSADAGGGDFGDGFAVGGGDGFDGGADGTLPSIARMSATVTAPSQMPRAMRFAAVV